MKSFKLESKEERKERAKNSIWNIENFKYKNITRELAEGYVNEYWVAGVVMLVISVILYSIMGQIGSFIFDAIIIAILSYGVYKKIRWMGLVFLIYFLIGKVIMFMDYTQYVNIGTIFVFLSFFRYFYLGTLGLFKLREINKNEVRN